MSRHPFALVMLTAMLAGTALAQQPEGNVGDKAVDNAPAVDELSEEEIQAELEKAQQVLAEPGEIEEYSDSTPVPADIPLSLPSDF